MNRFYFINQITRYESLKTTKNSVQKKRKTKIKAATKKEKKKERNKGMHALRTKVKLSGSICVMFNSCIVCKRM